MIALTAADHFADHGHCQWKSALAESAPVRVALAGSLTAAYGATSALAVVAVKDRCPPGGAIRGLSRPSTALDPEPTAQADPNRPLVACGTSAAREALRSYSITSSARPRIVCGTVSPSALAAFRLTTSWNFVDCWTGRSAGFSPFSTRPVYTPSSRFASSILVP
jgi:hypothetical protein